jgi:hypothetical protein
MYFCDVFSLEHAGELCINMLRRKVGEKKHPDYTGFVLFCLEGKTSCKKKPPYTH